MAQVLVSSIWLISTLGFVFHLEQESSSNELVLLAIDTKLPLNRRSSAIEEAALSDQWQTLARILLIVAIEHDNLLKQSDLSQLDIARNVGGAISLGVDEHFILRELERIGNPGAIPYIEKFRSIRSKQGFVHSGEYWASIDGHISRLKEKMLSWRPTKGEEEEEEAEKDEKEGQATLNENDK